MATADVVSALSAYDVPMVVVTGGEPLNQQRALVPVIERLVALGRRVEIETNGTVAPRPALAGSGAWFNVSPKLTGSGDPARRRIRGDALTALHDTGRAVFKFVCAAASDLAEVAELQQRYGLDPIWIMPMGRTPAEVNSGLAALSDAVVEHGWNLTTRLHVLAWGDERGR